MKYRTKALFVLTLSALSVLSVGLLTGAPLAAEPEIYSARGSAIRGYDPVAYFLDGKPTEGDAQFKHQWMGATWLFASAAHRDAFIESPEKYAPQYGGYCAYAVSQGSTAGIDPDSWTIVGDKLYLNYSKRIEARWLKNRDAYIVAADKAWPDVLK